ncbi:MAG: helix-turn-helix domain-containing protein [Anaerolineae bacterium]
MQSLREVGADLTHVEAKRAERALPRRLWETLSAFANTPSGGVIILGVDESDNPCRLPPAEPRSGLG